MAEKQAVGYKIKPTRIKRAMCTSGEDGMTCDSKTQLLEALNDLRRRLDSGFSRETAWHGVRADKPSAGHCAAVSAIARSLFGGELMQTEVDGYEHWFNRFTCSDGTIDCDITADQFGGNPVKCSNAGKLYLSSRPMEPDSLTAETLFRASVLARRAGMEKVAALLDGETRARVPAEAEIVEPML